MKNEIKKTYWAIVPDRLPAPSGTLEHHVYKNDANHGGTLSDVSIDKEPSYLLKEIFDECDESNQFRELSAIKYSFWPIIFLACRHHRQPIPMHFLQDLLMELYSYYKLSLFCILTMFSISFSIRIHRLFKLSHALPVVPLPATGSKTKSPSFV